jgi:NADH-quinone oxidoreductase subunit J
MTHETVALAALGAPITLCAIGVVAARKAVYSALCLAMSMILLAVLYTMQGAVFLGVVQVVVYTGAVLMLFLFVLMFVGIDSADALTETLRGQRVAVAVVGVGFGMLLIGAIGGISFDGMSAGGRGERPQGGNVADVAELIFTRYVWAFELTSALLITAALGAMVLAHRERFGRRKTQRELSQQRFRPGGQPTTLPSPGVYARHNAVDTPARLADGRFCDLSVSRTLHRDAELAP